MRILFICTHNRCRSILAEAIGNHFGEGRLAAFSAGSEPAGKVHPATLRYLEKHQIATGGLKSKSWEDLENLNPDVVITVCDQAAEEPCPAWIGRARKVHWSLPDPSRLADEQDVDQAFIHVIGVLKYRIITLRNWLEQGKAMEEIEYGMQQIASTYAKGRRDG